MVQICTEDKLVTEVLREQSIERGDVTEKDDKCEEEEPEMAVRDVLLSMTKLWRVLLSWNDLCIHAAKMLVLVQDEVVQVEMWNT